MVGLHGGVVSSEELFPGAGRSKISDCDVWDGAGGDDLDSGLLRGRGMPDGHDGDRQEAAEADEGSAKFHCFELNELNCENDGRRPCGSGGGSGLA